MTDRLEISDKVEQPLQHPDVQKIIIPLTYATTMLQIVNKYGWAVAWNLNSVMERVARND